MLSRWGYIFSLCVTLVGAPLPAWATPVTPPATLDACLSLIGKALGPSDPSPLPIDTLLVKFQGTKLQARSALVSAHLWRLRERLRHTFSEVPLRNQVELKFNFICQLYDFKLTPDGEVPPAALKVPQILGHDLPEGFEGYVAANFITFYLRDGLPVQLARGSRFVVREGELTAYRRPGKDLVVVNADP